MNVWLIGTGPMAIEYYKVLTDLDLTVKIIGRGEKSAIKFKKETGVDVFIGGLSEFLLTNPQLPEKAIVAVGVEQLCQCSIDLINAGVKDILVEKPGGLNYQQIVYLSQYANERSAEIYLGYNRRFYASVLKAQEIIQNDGGLTSFNFEFTEWSHKIKDIPKAEGVKEQWLIANSSHVIDLAFYLGGLPNEISCYSAGQGEIDWHPQAARYSGAGVTKNGVLFNYQANWNAPGRWRLEFLTHKHRLYFAPLEKLQIQDLGSIVVKDVSGIDYTLDEKYKPGLFLEVQFFIKGMKSLKTLKEQIYEFSKYLKKLEGSL